MLNLFAKSAPTPVIDRSFDCPQAESLRRQCEAGKYRSVSRKLKRIPDVDRRSFLIDVLSDAEDRPPRFDQWIEAQPDCAIARVTSGSHALEWAWQARGYVHAHQVTDAQWEEFFARLTFAKRELEGALA